MTAVGFLCRSTQPTSDRDRTTIPNTSVWHDSVLESSFAQVDTFQIGSSQVGISQVSAFKIGIAQVGSSQIGTSQSCMTQLSTNQSCITQVDPSWSSIVENGTSQVSSTQISSIQTGLEQVGITQIGTTQVGTIQGTLTEVNPAQVGITQVALNYKGITQVSPTQIDTSQVNSIQIGSHQVNSSKIPLPSSIPSEQFLSFHNSSPESIYTLNNSAQTLRSTLLSPQTPLDINLQITDLPTGQLAEATLTSFDPSGRPNGGTLLIDHNANGKGWYIDPTSTPFDHSASRLGFSVAKPNIFNPVKQGLVKAVKDWEYLSFHRYVAPGVYPMNWGMNQEIAFEGMLVGE